MLSADRHVSLITINRAEARNALNTSLLNELLAAFRAANKDKNCRVILLSGEGTDAFCSGADLKEISSGSAKQRSEFFRSLQTLLAEMIKGDKPIVAKVHGYALAGGMGLVAASDVVLASREAIFALPEIKVGLAALTILPILTSTLRDKELSHLLYTGDRLNAEEALRLGFVSRIFEKDALDREALHLALTLSERNFDAVIAIKRSVFECTKKHTLKMLPRGAREAIKLLKKKNTLSAINSFLENMQ